MQILAHDSLLFTLSMVQDGFVARAPIANNLGSREEDNGALCGPLRRDPGCFFQVLGGLQCALSTPDPSR